jgi:hypothetical protein
MKKIWKLLKSHLEDDFNPKVYLTVAIFLIVSVALNYKFNIENGIIDKDAGKPIRIVWYFILYGTAYFVVTLIVLGFNRKLGLLKAGRYWFITLAGLAILSINVGFPYVSKIALYLTQDIPKLYKLVFGLTNNLSNFLITALPLFIIARYYETKRENFGINRQNIDLKPYWQLLMIVAPLVIIASFEKGFNNYYPSYRRYEITDANNPTSLPTYMFGIFYEIAYGMDFFNVEFMFRGLMVIGVSQILGKEAILPMVSAYCFLHFGKPMGECISSIFGGYILGVVAFYTRNIWGGVIVHVGLALMMEVVAFLHRL